ncbi:hypothetical protein, partial [Streptococcus suis]|uniref:hypothetical protein n=1 Tax=Streptococcus suis TaxID=1307 RepID=UPI00378B92C1
DSPAAVGPAAAGRAPEKHAAASADVEPTDAARIDKPGAAHFAVAEGRADAASAAARAANAGPAADTAEQAAALPAMA